MPIRWALGCLVAFFTVDLAQAIVAAIVLRFWMRGQEKARWAEEETLEGDYQLSARVDVPAFVLWCIKILLLLAAFMLIAWHLAA